MRAEASGKTTFRLQTSRPFRFVVKSLCPLRTVLHLKFDYDLRESSCPQQERM